MSWSTLTVRTRVKEALVELKRELGERSYSDTIERLIELYRDRARRRGG